MRAELADRLARIDQLLHPGDTEKLLRRRRLGWRGVERDADLIKRRVGGRQDQIRRRQGVVRQRRPVCLHQAHRLPKQRMRLVGGTALERGHQARVDGRELCAASSSRYWPLPWIRTIIAHPPLDQGP